LTIEAGESMEKLQAGEEGTSRVDVIPPKLSLAIIAK
jgi:hypothetical protein